MSTNPHEPPKERVRLGPWVDYVVVAACIAFMAVLFIIQQFIRYADAQ